MTAPLLRRNVVHDNIATPGHPVWRARYATPLTPRRVRGHYVEQAMELPENQREGWLIARMTPLDRLLSEEEADALELYFDCEQLLAGNARCGDYTGDRVMTSRAGGMSPLPDAWLVPLAAHQIRKQRLTILQVEALALFVAQQAGAVLSDVLAAGKLGLKGRHRADAYVGMIAACATRLCG